MLSLLLSFAAGFQKIYPHFLHSCSQPLSTRLHIFWGRVQGPIPVLIERTGLSGWQQKIVSVQNCSQVEDSRVETKRKFKKERQPQMDYRSLSINFAIQSNEEVQRMTFTSIEDNIRLRWNKTDYQISLFKDQRLVSIKEWTNFSLTFRNMSARRTWEWAYRVQFLLQRDKQLTYNFINGSSKRMSNQQILNQQFTVVSFLFNFNPELASSLLFYISTSDNLQPPRISHSQVDLSLRGCANDAYNQLRKGMNFAQGGLRIKKNQDPTLFFNKILSFSPSRTRFPWSFLWDDGFHLQVIVRRQPQLAIRVLKSWLDTMSAQGWIPREQSRGAEREYLCNCQQFLVKDRRDGNPPSLILSLDYLSREHPQLLLKLFGNQYFQKVQRWYLWFMKTQRPSEDLLFKWFDSIAVNKQGGGSFNSGLDDFPRISNAHFKQIYHIDAQSWMYQFAKVMGKLALVFSQPHQKFLEQAQKIKKNAYRQLLDQTDFIFKDLLQETRGNKSFSPHLGYVNLLPLAFGLIQHDSPQLKAVVALIRDNQQLNSTYGLRSLSKRSPHFYQNQDSYWRGPIWININYLVLRGLRLYYPELKEVQEQLRGQVVRTVCENWKESGYFFQNYNGRSGKGSFSYPFSGWTATIANLVQGL